MTTREDTGDCFGAGPEGGTNGNGCSLHIGYGDDYDAGKEGDSYSGNGEGGGYCVRPPPGLYLDLDAEVP
mgnify:FL=1